MKLYMLKTEELSPAEIQLLRLCFPKRSARAQRMLRQEDRLQILGAGLLLHDALGIVDEDCLRVSSEGRPYLEQGPSFSLSHSGGRCVLAVGEGRIGVDLEKLQPSNLLAAQAALTAEELAWIQPQPIERFHILWTRKESLYKAQGGYRDPKQIPALEGRQPPVLRLFSSLTEGYALSLCTEEELSGELTAYIIQHQHRRDVHESLSAF